MTLLTATLSSSHRAETAEYQHRVYLNDGWTRQQRWDGVGTSTVDAGIDGPSQQLDSWTPAPTTGAGSTTVGIHTFRYRYLDSTTGYVSQASEERSVAVASGAETLTFPINTATATNMIRSTDAKVDRIVIEMTVARGSEFFKAAEGDQAAASLVVNISDPTLKVKFLPWPETGHFKPPIAEHIVAHQDRIIIFGEVIHSTGTVDVTNASADVDENATTDWSTYALGASAGAADVSWLIRVGDDTTDYEISYFDSGNSKLVLVENYGGTTATNQSYKIFSRANVIWVSNPGYPEGYTPLKFLNAPNGERAGDLEAAVGYGSSMVFFSQTAMWRLSWDLDPLLDSAWKPLSDFRGALNSRVVVEVEGTVYAMDRLGWHAWQGVFPKHISEPVDNVRDSIDFTKASNFHATWHPNLRAIRWFVVYTGDTYAKNYVQLDIDTGNWSTGTFNQGISESAVVPTATGLEVFYGDENGHVWQADTGTCDGVDSTMSHLTVAASATTTVIPVDEALVTSNAGLGGAYVYWVEGAEGAVVAANTASEITLASAFTSAPADGDILWVGPVAWKLKTPAFSYGLDRVSRFRYLWILFEPHASSRRFKVRFFADYGSTASTVASNTRKDPAGVIYPGNVDSVWTIAAATSDWLIKQDYTGGAVRVPVPSEFVRVLEAEIEGVESDAHLEIIGFILDGESTERLLS